MKVMQILLVWLLVMGTRGMLAATTDKPNIGSAQERLPNFQGVDEWYGITRTTDESMFPSQPGAQALSMPFMHTMEGRKGEKSREVTVYELEQRRLIDAEITRRTIDFMSRSARAGKPFYAYVPFTQVHFLTLPNPKFAGKTGHGDFADCFAEMDAHVGEILDAVNGLKIIGEFEASLKKSPPSRPARWIPTRLLL